MVIFLSPNITAAHTLFYNFLLSDCLSVLYACYAISSGRPSWVDIRKQNSRRCLVVAYKHTRSVECLALVSSLRDNLFHRHHHHTHLKCWSYSVAVSSEFSQHRPPDIMISLDPHDDVGYNNTGIYWSHKLTQGRFITIRILLLVAPLSECVFILIAFACPDMITLPASHQDVGRHRWYHLYANE